MALSVNSHSSSAGATSSESMNRSKSLRKRPQFFINDLDLEMLAVISLIAALRARSNELTLVASAPVPVLASLLASALASLVCWLILLEVLFFRCVVLSGCLKKLILIVNKVAVRGEKCKNQGNGTVALLNTASLQATILKTRHELF